MGRVNRWRAPGRQRRRCGWQRRRQGRGKAVRGRWHRLLPPGKGGAALHLQRLRHSANTRITRRGKGGRRRAEGAMRARHQPPALLLQRDERLPTVGTTQADDAAGHTGGRNYHKLRLPPSRRTRICSPALPSWASAVRFDWQKDLGAEKWRLGFESSAGSGAAAKASLPPKKSFAFFAPFGGRLSARRQPTRRAGHDKISFTTCPCTSVRRKSRPAWRKVSFSWSRPSICSSVAWRSCMCTLPSTAMWPSSSVLPWE